MPSRIQEYDSFRFRSHEAALEPETVGPGPLGRQHADQPDAPGQPHQRRQLLHVGQRQHVRQPGPVLAHHPHRHARSRAAARPHDTAAGATKPTQAFAGRHGAGVHVVTTTTVSLFYLIQYLTDHSNVMFVTIFSRQTRKCGFGQKDALVIVHMYVKRSAQILVIRSP